MRSKPHTSSPHAASPSWTPRTPPSPRALHQVLPNLHQFGDGDAAQGARCSPSQATQLREALSHTSQAKPPAQLLVDLPLSRDYRCWPLHLTNSGPPMVWSCCISTAMQDWQPPRSTAGRSGSSLAAPANQFHALDEMLSTNRLQRRPQQDPTLAETEETDTRSNVLHFQQLRK